MSSATRRCCAGLDAWIRARESLGGWALAPGDREGELPMSGNADLLKKGYDAFARGDMATASEALPDDFVLEGYVSEGLVLSGVHEGKQAVLHALGAMVEGYDEYKFVADEFIEQGDTIVVLNHTELRKGERSLKLPGVAVWRFEDGRPRRQQVFIDKLAIARVRGIV